MIGTRKQRVTIRLTDNQMLCLKELTESLDTTLSLLIRSIIQDFLVRNEDALERITLNKNEQNNANNKPTKKEN